MLDLLEAAGVGLDDLYQLQEIQDIQDIQDLVNLNTLHDLVLENPTPKTNVDDSVTYDSVDGKSTKGRRNKSRQGGRNNIKGSSRRNRGRKKDRNRPKLRNEGMGGKSGDVEGSEGSNDADLASFYQYVDELHSGNRNISHRAIHRQRRGLGHGMGHYSDPVSRGRNTTSRMDLGVGMGVDFKEMGIQEVDEMMELEFMAQLLNQSHFSHYHSNRSYQSQVPGSPPYTASTPSHKMSSSSAVHVHTNEDQHFPEDDSCRSREDTSNSPSRRTHRREPKKRKEKKEEREREREHEKKKTKEKKTEEEGQRRRKRKKKKRLVADVSASALPSSPLSSSSFSSTSVASPASLPGSSSLTMSEQRGADRPSNLHSSGITYLAHSPTSQTGVVDDKTGKKSGFTKSTTNNAKNSRAGKHCKHQLTMTESQTSEREAAALSSVTPPLSSACSSALSFPCMFPKCNQMWRVNATSSLTITATQRKRLKLEVRIKIHPFEYI